jgi:hypothetical protein
MLRFLPLGHLQTIILTALSLLLVILLLQRTSMMDPAVGYSMEEHIALTM